MDPRRRPTAGSTAPPARARPVVWCASCGRVEFPSAADLAGFVQSGWPQCCGEVMVYALEGEPGAPCRPPAAPGRGP